MKHENYEVLNLIGYGMAKFGPAFVQQFGFTTKTAFYNYIISLGIASTEGVVKNRQDLFDPYFDNGRTGWVSGADRYVHRKLFIDSFLGNEDVVDYAEFVKLYLTDKYQATGIITALPKPILASKFKQIQLTGREAETYFLNNIAEIPAFQNGIIEDARLYGDGYDFQVKTPEQVYLAEVKGLSEKTGGFRLTANEFARANEYKERYFLVMVSNLSKAPKLSCFANPVAQFKLNRAEVKPAVQVYYSSEVRNWG